MIITEVVQNGLYTCTYSDTYHIRNVQTGNVCVKSHEPIPTQWEETNIKLPPDPEQMAEALGILGVKV